jgi:hypothetical protein
VLGRGGPRVARTPVEAAASIGVSRDFFDAHVAPELRPIRRGRKRLVPVAELARLIVCPVRLHSRKHWVPRPPPRSSAAAAGLKTVPHPGRAQTRSSVKPRSAL